jgi:hypothetical protein
VAGDPINKIDPSGLYECIGGKVLGNSNCERFQEDLNTLAKAADAKGATKEQKAAISGVLAAYGKAGEKNGVTVNFGSLKQGTLGQTTDLGKGQISVKFDYDQIDADTSKGNRGLETASVVGHEGQHVEDFQRGTFRSDIQSCNGSMCVTPNHFKNLETSAYTTQFLMNQAMHNKSNIGPNSLQDARSRGYDEGTDECNTSPICQ